MPVEHMFIPDTQVRPGVPTDHILAAANYACHKKPDKIIIAGDWYDFPSLANFERPGHKDLEGQRLMDDIEAGDAAFHLFMNRIEAEPDYDPEIHFLAGNHEYRLIRAAENNPRELDGILGYDMIAPYWHPNVIFHDFLEIVELDGILYSHYFVNPQSMMKRALTGSIDNRLNKIGQSFTMGHQQIMQWGPQPMANGRFRYGLVCGAFYQHEEKYLGPQGNNYWRGCVYKHEVRNGEYDPMMLSLNYLLENWL